MQEGAEDVGVVVQNHLLKRHRQLPPFGGVKFLGQLLDQRRDFRIVISAKIVAHARNAGGREEILGVAGGGCYQRGGVNIPAAHVRQELPAVCGAVDVHVNADLFEGRLGGLGQQGQLLTGGVGQPADGQLHAVLFPDAVAVGIHPARFLQNRLRTLGVVGFRRDVLAAKGGEAVGERTVGRDAVAVQEGLHEALLVDAHGDCPADGGILDDGAGHVHGAEEGAGGLDGGELITAVFKIGVGLIGHAVGGVDIPGL